MENLTFGLLMLILGMGGTLVILALLAGLIRVLTLLFPVQGADQPEPRQ